MGFLSKLIKGLTFVTAIVTGVEPIFGAKNGDQKKASAVGLIGDIIGITEAISSKDIVDDKAFKEGVEQMIDGAVKCLNASVWYKK